MKGWVIMKSPEEWEGTRLGLAIPIHTQLRLSNQGQGSSWRWWWCHWVGWCCCWCCCWALPSRKWQGGSALTSSPCLSSSNLSSGTAAPVLILHQYTKCTQYTYILYIQCLRYFFFISQVIAFLGNRHFSHFPTITGPNHTLHHSALYILSASARAALCLSPKPTHPLIWLKNSQQGCERYSVAHI